MLDVAKFKQHLLESGFVDKLQVERAQKYAFEKGLSLSDALLALNIVGFRKLGQCLSDVYGLPYVGIQNRGVPPEARRVLSAACVTHWKVFPVEWDHASTIFTLAIYDPDQAPKIEKVFKFLMHSAILGFVIVSRAEMKAALAAHYLVASDPRPAPAGLPLPGTEKKKLALSGLHHPAPVSAVKSSGEPASDATSNSEPKRPLLRGQTAATPERAGASASSSTTAAPSGQGFDISRSLLSSVALLVQSRLHSDPDKIWLAKARVRYCRLLAARANGTPESCDAVALAAWLSVLDAPRTMARQLVTPYDLEGILSGESTAELGMLPEAMVLNLVQHYQVLKAKDLAAARDIHQVRDALRSDNALVGEDPYLETFLQILMDEEFLFSQEKASGRIVIVDPSESASPSLAPPLADDGYDVDVEADPAAAYERCRVEQPDAILVSMDFPRQGGLKFCQKIKKDPAMASIPVIGLLPKDDSALATECLRAGVEDCLARPIDLERLFLRLGRIIKPSVAVAEEKGVKGSLADMSFTDMVQILCAGGKSLEIHLKSPAGEGCVHVAEGNIVHAAAADKTGVQAFYEIMQWTEGEFATRPRKDFSVRSIQASLMSLVIVVARLADEA